MTLIQPIDADVFRPPSADYGTGSETITARYPSPVVETLERIMEVTHWKKAPMMRYLIMLGAKTLLQTDPRFQLDNNDDNT